MLKRPSYYGGTANHEIPKFETQEAIAISQGVTWINTNHKVFHISFSLKEESDCQLNRNDYIFPENRGKVELVIRYTNAHIRVLSIECWISLLYVGFSCLMMCLLFSKTYIEKQCWLILKTVFCFFFFFNPRGT